MLSDTLGQNLHDRSTRGELLSTEEQEQLTYWYEQQDELEGEILNLAPQDDTTAKLESKIEAALAQLAIVTNQIQALSAENKILRFDMESSD